MPEEPEKSGQEPNLELPSLLGFGRKKKKSKTDTVADAPAPDEVVAEEPEPAEPAAETDDPLAADPVPQTRAGLAPATNRPKRRPPVPPPAATGPRPEVVPEVRPEAETAVQPEVVPEAVPEVEPEPVAEAVPEVQPEVRRDSEDTEVIETLPPQEPVAVRAAEPLDEQRPAAPSATTSAPTSDAPLHEGRVGGADEEPAHEPVGSDSEPVELSETPRERPPRRSLPVINPRLAAGLTGGAVGLVGVLLTSVAGRSCEVIRGVGSCGGIGLLALLVILALEVLLGAVLLQAWRISDPGSTSFLGVGLAAVFVLLFLLSSLESPWMLLVIPVLTVLTFLLSWWVTESFAETSVDDLHR